MNQPAAQFSSLTFDDDDDFSSVENDVLHVNYAHTDYLPSHTATQPRQETSGILTKVLQDKFNLFYDSQTHWHFSRKRHCEKIFGSVNYQPASEKQLIPKTNPFTYIPHRTLEI